MSGVQRFFTKKSKNYYLLTNLLTEEETKIITSVNRHIENDERRIGVQQIANASGAALRELIDRYDEEKGRQFCELLRRFRTRNFPPMKAIFPAWPQTTLSRGWPSACYLFPP